jgi:glycosyltransferase involved in cell wall biosynthesis
MRSGSKPLCEQSSVRGLCCFTCGNATFMASTGTVRSLLVWHVHGSWLESLTAGRHRYVLPVNEAADNDGRGLSGRLWPRAQEVAVDELRDEDIDLVVLQRPHELELAEQWLGRRPGVDVPAVYVEHNAPRPSPVDSVHPIASRTDIPLIHVTDFNRLMWDNGAAPTRVISHGIADPGHLYTGDIAAAASMINEPLRRWRTVGTDLLIELGAHVPIDVWGIDTLELNRRERLGVRAKGDVPTRRLMRQVARRRVYLHTARWTSLGMSLVEAMYLGLPVVAVASTMAPSVIPDEAGVVSADVATLARALQGFLIDHAAAALAGKAAREYAIAHFSLDRFLSQWEEVIDERCA